MTDTPSPRLLDQRLRNRIFGAVELLADGDAGVRSVGASEYFNRFFDFVEDDCAIRPNSAMSAAEHSLLVELCRLVNAACDATPRTIGADDLIATGWPARIAAVATPTLQTFAARGLFREDEEEAEPSLPVD